MNLEELKNKLHSNGFGEFFDNLQHSLRNAIRLYPSKTDENNIPIGQSKIGGRPDLPDTITWVTETKIVETTVKRFKIFTSKKQEEIVKPLSFIAQLNLAEISKFDKDDLLPKSGMLYFFYSAEQEAWGFKPSDKDKFKVIYWDGNISKLKRIDFPDDLPSESCFFTCSIEIRSEVSLPYYGHEVYDELTSEQQDVLFEDVVENNDINKLFGYADIIQNEMELECELVSNGLYCGDGSGYEDPRAELLKPNAKDWRLLLQVDSIEEIGIMWGDCGRIYYWIKKEDLRNGDFDKSWLILQCS